MSLVARVFTQLYREAEVNSNVSFRASPGMTRSSMYTLVKVHGITPSSILEKAEYIKVESPVSWYVACCTVERSYPFFSVFVFVAKEHHRLQRKFVFALSFLFFGWPPHDGGFWSFCFFPPPASPLYFFFPLFFFFSFSTPQKSIQAPLLCNIHLVRPTFAPRCIMFMLTRSTSSTTA